MAVIRYDTVASVIEYFQPALIALVGALVGGLCAIYGAYVTHRNNLKEYSLKEKGEIDNFLRAIHTEIATVWERYEKTYKPHVDSLKDGEYLNEEYPITQDYFTVYNNNTNLLGKLEDSDLRRSVVVVYTQAKALIDSLLCNNESLRKYNIASFEQSREQASIHDAHMLAYKKELLEYAPAVKQQSIELEKNVRSLLNRLSDSKL